MTKLEMHPTVRRFREREARPEAPGPSKPAAPLDEAWLRRLCEEAGVDDVGFVAITDRPRDRRPEGGDPLGVPGDADAGEHRSAG